MIVIKKLDNYLNVIAATLLNIEHGVKKYIPEAEGIRELPDEEATEPMLTIELPGLHAGRSLRLKINSRYGFIFCLLDKGSIEQFVRQVKTVMSTFSDAHLMRNITALSHSTITMQDAPPHLPPRRFIITNHILGDTVLSGFTWYVSGLIDQVFSPHVYSKM